MSKTAATLTVEPSHEVLDRPAPLRRPAGARLAAYAGDASLYDARTNRYQTWRHRLVDLLPLRPGDVVLDIGCGTGLSFPLLQERIGPEGRIVGVDPSPDMLGVAAARVADKGWRNVTLIEAAAEDAELPQADHALLCAVHDVLQSPAALENVVAHLRPGGSIGAGGGKWAPPWAVVVNVTVRNIHAPYVHDFTGFNRPWARLAGYVEDLRVHEVALGGGYLAVGRTQGGPGGRTLQTRRR